MAFLNLGKKLNPEAVQEVLDAPDPLENMELTDGNGDEIASILQQGAASADAEPSDLELPQEQQPAPGFPVLEPEKRKRGRPRKTEAQPSELEMFFSKDGIGAVWVNGLNAFYALCDAPPLSPAETDMHKRVFAAWCKARMPAEASKYQPDILLAATLAMSTLPRLQPIAKTTVPLWRRAFNFLRGKRNVE